MVTLLTKSLDVMITCANNNQRIQRISLVNASRSKLVGEICDFTSYSPLQLFKNINNV